MAKGYSSYTAQTLTWVKWSVTAAVFAGFGSLVWFAVSNQDELIGNNLEAPVVSAQEGAVKERPEQRGGMDIPNQDKKVFDLLASKAATQSLEVENKDDIAQAIASAKEDLQEVDLAVVPARKADPLPKEPEQPKSPAKPVMKTVIADPKPTEVEKPVAPKIAAPAVEKPAAVTAMKTGQYGVQLASFRSRGDAEKAAQKFASKHNSILGGMQVDIQRADLGAKGVYYRVRFMGADSRTAAAGVCNKLKSAGQGCFPASR